MEKLRTITQHPGHRIYELNVKTFDFEEVKPEKDQGKKSKLVLKDGHLYCSALNPASAEKKFFAMLSKLIQNGSN